MAMTALINKLTSRPFVFFGMFTVIELTIDDSPPDFARGGVAICVGI